MPNIRLASADDLPHLVSINAASVPGVSIETAEELEEIGQLGQTLVATDSDDVPIGFISLIRPGTAAYVSPNLRWLEEWSAQDGRRLIYVDRIAVAAHARGASIGTHLYAAAIEEIGDRFELIGCEVNTKPDNPGSHRFHQRLGFRRIGEQAFSATKAVAYYVRPVAL